MEMVDEEREGLLEVVVKGKELRVVEEGACDVGDSVETSEDVCNCSQIHFITFF